MLKKCSRHYELIITAIFSSGWPESQVNFDDFDTNKWPAADVRGWPWKVIYRRNSSVPRNMAGQKGWPVMGSGRKGRFYFLS